jgi:hypothetical protein
MSKNEIVNLRNKRKHFQKIVKSEYGKVDALIHDRGRFMRNFCRRKTFLCASKEKRALCLILCITWEWLIIDMLEHGTRKT